ncbi:MAG: GerMN domain-containing protein [Anaerolineae bacterium]
MTLEKVRIITVHSKPCLSFQLLILVMAMGLLAACTPAVSSPTPLRPTETPIPPSSTPVPPTATPVPPSPTPISPTATAWLPSPTPIPPTATLVPSSTRPVQQTVQIFLIALEDNGQSGKRIGCGDSVVPVQVTIPATQAVLRAALEALLSLNEQFYGQSGLYNALYQFNLQLEGVTIEGGKAIINLSGTLMLGGVCDNPRVEAQIEESALQFSTVREVSVFVNGKPLEEILSLKG